MTKAEAIIVNLSTSGSRLGGAAIAAEWHSRFLASQFPVELWRMYDQDTELMIDQLKIKQFKTKSPNLLITMFPKQIKAFFLESNILEGLLNYNPKLIHLQNPLPSLAFEKIAKKCHQCGIKVVISTHGFFEVMNSYKNFRFPQKIAWQKLITEPIIRSVNYIDAVLSGYPNEKQMLKQMGFPDDKIYLVPNGINPFFKQAPSSEELMSVIDKFQINPENPILLFIGNHTFNKGLDTVLKIASQLQKPTSVIIGGKLLSTHEPQEWFKKIPSSKKANVIFTDYLSLAEQRALYHLATILLFPSLADTLPLTILEAMACGLPVIAYNVGGISYQLENDAGIVVPVADFETYFNSVEYLLNNEQIRTQIAAQSKLRQRKLFSWKIASTETIAIYQKLINCS